MAECWTKQSFCPSAGVTKPKPFASLNHFTVPVVRITCSLLNMLYGRPEHGVTVPTKNGGPGLSQIPENAPLAVCSAQIGRRAEVTVHAREVSVNSPALPHPALVRRDQPAPTGHPNPDSKARHVPVGIERDPANHPVEGGLLIPDPGQRLPDARPAGAALGYSGGDESNRVVGRGTPLVR